MDLLEVVVAVVALVYVIGGLGMLMTIAREMNKVVVILASLRDVLHEDIESIHEDVKKEDHD